MKQNIEYYFINSMLPFIGKAILVLLIFLFVSGILAFVVAANPPVKTIELLGWNCVTPPTYQVLPTSVGVSLSILVSYMSVDNKLRIVRVDDVNITPKEFNSEACGKSDK